MSERGYGQTALSECEMIHLARPRNLYKQEQKCYSFYEHVSTNEKKKISTNEKKKKNFQMRNFYFIHKA